MRRQEASTYAAPWFGGSPGPRVRSRMDAVTAHNPPVEMRYRMAEGCVGRRYGKGDQSRRRAEFGVMYPRIDLAGGRTGCEEVHRLGVYVDDVSCNSTAPLGRTTSEYFGHQPRPRCSAGRARNNPLVVARTYLYLFLFRKATRRDPIGRPFPRPILFATPRGYPAAPSRPCAPSALRLSAAAEKTFLEFLPRFGDRWPVGKIGKIGKIGKVGKVGKEGKVRKERVLWPRRGVEDANVGSCRSVLLLAPGPGLSGAWT
ncbi:hypothetical protein KM043_000199 [Ampulex compressa]|nr:hypothetical protein KM043_000199 [Ampulex compressa]